MHVSSHIWIFNAISSILIFAAGRVSALVPMKYKLSDIKSFLLRRISWKNKQYDEVTDERSGERPVYSISYVNAIYEKLLKYFEKEKPYLNADLSINVVAKALLTNKMYVAKAIKTFASTNFPQFVNSYRIKYAIHLFQQDTSLRVGELAFRSGFNSTASFNIAFKTNMNMTPGEWCRRYKLDQ